MEVILLGTGAATPTPQRWPASTAVIRKNEVLLFDCGEGIQVQFLKAGLKPGKLSQIFISHLHGDHINGLIGFLTSLQLGDRKKPVELYGPKGLADYINYMQNLSSFGLEFVLKVFEIDEKNKATTWDKGEYIITAMPLKHRIFAAGFRLEEKPLPGKFNVTKAEELGIKNGPERGRLLNGESIQLEDGRTVSPQEVVGDKRAGRKIAICVDSAPCKNSVKLAQGVDLLIHEATFDESHQGVAKSTGHSTAAQAAEVARTAKVKKLVLTHVSQRYNSNEKKFEAQAKAIFPNTHLGSDLARFPV